MMMCFLLAGASRSPSGTKAPSPELETDNGCGTGLKCDHKCISYDGVSQCVCRDGYQLHMNGYSCVGKPTECWKFLAFIMDVNAIESHRKA